MMALKFEESMVKDANHPLTCDFCYLTLKVLESDETIHSKETALQELKTFFSNKVRL